MATPVKRGSKWYVQVCVNGKRPSASFDTKARAMAWAVATEAELKNLAAGGIPSDISFGDLIARYRDEVSPTKRSREFEETKINAMFKREDPILKVKLANLSAADVAAWRNRRLLDVSPDAVLREWNILSPACTLARKEWGWLKANPFSDVTRPKPGAARTRRLEPGETERILLALGCNPESTPETETARVGLIFLFAVETAMRSGEICGLQWGDIQGRVAHLRKTKNGDARDVPLSTEALRILSLLPKGEPDESVFGVSDDARDALFRKAKDRALIEDLHFHDTRREALTRLSRKVDVMTLAKISGHRDLRILQNTYYAPRMQDVAALLG